MDSSVPGAGLGVGVARPDNSAGIGSGGCGVAGVHDIGATGGRSSATSGGGGLRVRETLRWCRGGGTPYSPRLLP